MLLACVEMLRFGIPRHARSTSIGENSGEMLRSVHVRLNIAVEFEDILGKRALALSGAGEIQRIVNLAPRLPLADSDLVADHYIALGLTTTPHFDVPAPGLGVDPRLDWR